MPANLKDNKNIELGIHPNFNFLLNGDFRNGRNAEEIVDRLLEIVPNANCVRSHAMTQSSGLLELFYNKGLTHDCNHFIPEQTEIILKPWSIWNGLIKVPYFWEDDINCVSENRTAINDLVNRKGIKVFDFHQIKGKSNTLNEMIKHCKYDYVALLDVDDIWHDEKLTVQSQMLNHYDVIGSNCVWFGDRAGVVPVIPVEDISNFNFALVNPIINSSSIIRKELCHWNENGIEDYDLWIRLRKQNKRFYNCKAVLVKHRIHTASAFNSKGNDDLVPKLLKLHGFERTG